MEQGAGEQEKMGQETMESRRAGGRTEGQQEKASLQGEVSCQVDKGHSK